MNILLDTHIALWFQSKDKRLSKDVRDIIEYSDRDLFVSQASLWEMAIKISLGKLVLDQDLQVTFQLFEEAGFLILPLTNSQFLEVSK